MKTWSRLLAWLRPDGRALAVEAARLAYLEGHSAGQQAGYLIGRAQGELIGREALALELQQAYGFGEDGVPTMKPDEMRDLRVKQLH